ncbi:methylated-DNA-[protein]-cysteine S-methyltransferase [Chitinivorax tropicus]|uniref:Methylated-DNA--protein-cysteine methyltransferase n=1 Tax=Chitinivorax tropicus TaxID=714531 RepID=A0A840MKA6_9PROT|nr:methylated-DNA--[protein]-cysteine S-methyltransferase [Chitinivorax tropicus]MBB5017935.1 methylated-DNA-[protein]-cysteine S-methyltransferase [Chitinivorax tropicus]
MHYAFISSPLGDMLATANAQGLTGLYFVDQRYYPGVQATWLSQPDHLLFQALAAQLVDYFAGVTAPFDLPLAPIGTPFQQQVWRQLLAIPAGHTWRYGEIACQLGCPQGARAVGAAVGRNPISIVIPCHRVIGSNGSLTGYAGGLPRKQHLLLLEGALTA